MAPTLSDSEAERTRAAVARHRAPAGRVNLAQLADDLGVRRSTAANRLRLLDIPLDTAPKFESLHLPSPDLTIEELIARRLEDSDRSMRADDARQIIPVKVNLNGPFGLFVMGDPHIDDQGCNFRLLKNHVELIKPHPHVVVGHIGDITNNWVGRLARLYADQSTTAREAWLLAEWLLNEIEPLFCILGNHDMWSGHGNPIDWILRHSPGVTEAHGVRLALRQPCGAETRVHARHNFKGTSIYNELHGLKREVLMGLRDHVLIAGHHHVGGDQGTVAPDGLVSQIVRVSGYKQADHYAKELGLKSAHIHASALIIIDPTEPDTSRGRAFCAPTVEKGLLILDALRRAYERSTE